MERKLAAIRAADAVGYCGLMEAEEAGTLPALMALRQELIKPLIGEHNGRIVKLMDDGILVEIACAVDADACAMANETALAKRGERIAAEHD